jgi:pimeloyl-ACP methyl ester carboxylesterase
MRLPTPKAADRRGVHDGRPYELWLPEADPDPPWPGMVILHGAGSRKENHGDFARACNARGWAALTFDQRGHGDSEDVMSPVAIGDAGRMARFLASVEGVDPGRVCVRGSSMGGFMAIHAAATSDSIRGVIAICPAGEEHLRRGLRRGELEMRADEDALEAWLGEHDLREAVALMGSKPLILIHARGDEQIPYTWSEELHGRAAEPSKLIVLPGGHHRSAQHDAELQGIALRWLERALG